LVPSTSPSVKTTLAAEAHVVEGRRLLLLLNQLFIYFRAYSTVRRPITKQARKKKPQNMRKRRQNKTTATVFPSLGDPLQPLVTPVCFWFASA
jgi:hypothetical protein